MSWGYLVELELELPAATHDAWGALASSAFPLPPAWPSEALAGYFTPPAGGPTLAAVLAAPDWAATATTERHGDQVKVRLVAAVDRSLLTIAGAAPALLRGAVQLGGSGSLVICSDGSADEPGWRVAVDDDGVTLVTEPLGDDEMDEELERLAATLV